MRGQTFSHGVKMKILFLDDDPERHQIVVAKMEGPDDKLAGTEVVHAWTVDEAIEALERQGPFDLVYLDHDLNDHTKKTGKESRFYDMYGAKELTGADVATWMARNMVSAEPKPVVILHTHNSAGALTMLNVLRDGGFSVVWELFGVSDKTEPTGE